MALFNTSKMPNTDIISIDVLSFFYVNRLDFRDTHQMKNYANLLKNWNIDGAVNTKMIFHLAIIWKNWLYFLEESWSLKSYT